MKTITTILLLSGMLYLFGTAFSSAVDHKIDSQNKMLCDSAKVSGNREYKKLCKAYYETGDITAVRLLNVNKQ